MACGVCPSKPNHVQFSHCSVMLDSLWPHGLQHARLPCPSPSPRAWLKLMSIESVMPSNCLILWAPFSSCPQYFPAWGSFPMSRLFASSGRSIGASASASSEYSGLVFFRIDWFDLLGVQGTLRSLLQYYSSKTSAFAPCFLYGPTLTSIHDYWWKNHSFDSLDLCQH